MKKWRKYIIGGFIVLILLSVTGVLATYYYKKTMDNKRIPFPVYLYKIRHADPMQKKYILMSPFRSAHWLHGRLIIMDMSGNIIFQKCLNSSACCFRQWKLNGKIRYTYFLNYQDANYVKDVKLTSGNFIVTDSALNQINRFCYIPNDTIKTNEKQGLDFHDIIPLADDHYISMSVYVKSAKNIPAGLHPSPYKKVAFPLLQEVKDGKLIWHWDASGYPELYGTSMEHNNYSDSSKISDYLHINSLSLDPRDSNLICSFRNSNQVIKIDKATGKIAWKLGGDNSDFPLTKEQFFLKQHDAKLVDNDSTLMILDNGDSATRQASRVLEFRLDEKNRKVTLFRSYIIPGPYIQYMGNVEKQGDTYFINGGSSNYILEINTKTGNRSFELFSNLLTYRAYMTDEISGITK